MFLTVSRKRKPKTYDLHVRPPEKLRTLLNSRYIKPCFNQDERLKSLPFQQAEVY